MHDDEARAHAALALFRAGKPGQAAAAFRELLTRHPGWGEAWFNLGCILKSQGQAAGALGALSRAIQLGMPAPEEALLTRAVLHADLLRDDTAAYQDLQQAMRLRPQWLPALLNLGNLHEERGDAAAAASAYDAALAAPVPKAEAAEASRHLDCRAEAGARSALLRPAGEVGEAELERLRTWAADADRSVAVRANVGLARGRILDAQARFDEAFASFDAAKQLLRDRGRPYQSEVFEQAVGHMIAAYDGSETVAPNTADGPAIVFICGMFRSGSTLVEQVLGAHPQVCPGGELDLLMRLVVQPPVAPFPERVRLATPAELDSVAAAYRTQLLARLPAAASATCVTDKRPDNFLFIGLIKSLFPQARIVHTRRHPMDTGLSIYSHHLNTAQLAYSSDLAAIGHYTGQYRRLMAHWTRRYGDDIHTVDYEQLVRDPNTQTQALLAFLGLPWDDACLDFHRHVGTVKTASYWQVRQPLHPRSAGRWQNYRQRLEPLACALRDAGVDDWA